MQCIILEQTHITTKNKRYNLAITEEAAPLPAVFLTKHNPPEGTTVLSYCNSHIFVFPFIILMYIPQILVQ